MGKLSQAFVVSDYREERIKKEYTFLWDGNIMSGVEKLLEDHLLFQTKRTVVVYKFREERQFLRVSRKYRKRGEKHETSKVQVHYLATPILECYSVQSIGQFGEMKKKVDPEKARTKVVNLFLTKIVALCGYFILHSLFLCRKPFKAQWGQSLYENAYM